MDGCSGAEYYRHRGVVHRLGVHSGFAVFLGKCMFLGGGVVGG